MSTFPFEAVVGHDDAKLALRLAALDPLLGGVLLRGHKGTAKTTLARGLAALLGDAPFVELPLGATEDRLVGSLDVSAALRGGEVTFHPGLLANAHGGVLYVDEINLLADHLVDVLLDVAASGRNIVERDGVSHQHPARFVLVGSMNPEEGELRPQLLDRFGLCVTVETTTDLAERAEAVKRRLAFDRGEPLPATSDVPTVSAVGLGLTEDRAAIDEDLIAQANRLAVAVGAEGLRADLALCRAAAALATLEGASVADTTHLQRVAPLVLAHRCRRGPFDPPVLPPEAISQACDQVLGDSATEPPRTPEGDETEPKGPDGPDGSDGPDNTNTSGTESSDGSDQANNSGGSDQADANDEQERSRPTSRTRPLTIGAARQISDPLGSRAVVSTRGRVIGDAPARDGDPIAIVPTARHRALNGASSDAAPRTATRVDHPRRTTVLCVDLSGSMGAASRAEVASGTVIGLLGRAYERREQVALVTFSGAGAEVVLSPTASVEVARHRLGDLHIGGETPLAEGLLCALEVARKVRARGDDATIMLLSDGHATGSSDAFDRALAACADIRRAGIGVVVLDCDSSSVRLGLTEALAAALDAPLVDVANLDAAALTTTLQQPTSARR